MIQLSVNVNKVATLRNSRGGNQPSVCDAVQTCLDAGVPGITVHPRGDERHITRQDVLDIAGLLRHLQDRVEFNIEGDPRPDLLELVLQVRPTQCTLVPVIPGEITSQAGWTRTATPPDFDRVVARLREAGVRVSLFVDPQESAVDWAASLGADRVELYTEPYARAFERGPVEARASFEQFARAARRAHERGLGVNAGHDLDLQNLPLFASLPHLAEVSIGHALISRALFVGLPTVVREYLAICEGHTEPT
ncbi:MAG TPA: pyridoxine 5'-phosphate synthase [Planctomycetaceae bacterium]|nr:pyridoxine 5'-phosphate synthase [Planctomycetaceae bacterium]